MKNIVENDGDAEVIITQSMLGVGDHQIQPRNVCNTLPCLGKGYGMLK